MVITWSHEHYMVTRLTQIDTWAQAFFTAGNERTTRNHLQSLQVYCIFYCKEKRYNESVTLVTLSIKKFFCYSSVVFSEVSFTWKFRNTLHTQSKYFKSSSYFGLNISTKIHNFYNKDMWELSTCCFLIDEIILKVSQNISVINKYWLVCSFHLILKNSLSVLYAVLKQTFTVS